MDWNAYFAMMEDWKQLPAYKAEPRIDSLIGFYLSDMASDYFQDTITGIIPELPIRLATVQPQHEGTTYADRSYKVDFYLLGESGTNYFVEFKTDSGSRRIKQDTYLGDAKHQGMAAITGGITRIASVSSYKKKYSHLLEKLTALGLINETKQFTGKSDTIKVIYVQPRRQDQGTIVVIDFRWISQWLTKKYAENEYEDALSRTLLRWSVD